MIPCFFVSDLHGHMDRYQTLFERLEAEQPGAVFVGGDFLPSGLGTLLSGELAHRDFIQDYLAEALIRLKIRMKEFYPRIFIIPGNDDGRFEEAGMLSVAARGLWEYAHNRRLEFRGFQVYGYSFVPPTPFQLKDWERYDVSRFVDPGCVSPEEGMRTIPVSDQEQRFTTIQKDLIQLARKDSLEQAVFLFHAPPHKTNLDRAALDGKMVDHVPVDVHVGSIAIRRFIEDRQPLLTLHGHIHESCRLTGAWRDRIGRTHIFSAAHGGPELSLIRFDLENPEDATRELI